MSSTSLSMSATASGRRRASCSIFSTKCKGNVGRGADGAFEAFRQLDVTSMSRVVIGAACWRIVTDQVTAATGGHDDLREGFRVDLRQPPQQHRVRMRPGPGFVTAKRAAADADLVTRGEGVHDLVKC